MNTLLPHELEWLTKLFKYNTKIILNCKPLKLFFSIGGEQ
jgi:hypothetical protein